MAESTSELAGPASPFAGLALVVHEGVARLIEVPAMSRFVLRAAPGVAARLGDAIGIGLAGAINTAVASDPLLPAAMRLGPDEWLLLAGPSEGEALAARLTSAAGPDAISLVEASHRNAAVLLTGPEAAAVLAVGCPLPLDERAFPVGRATRTVLARAEILLWRQAPDQFHIEMGRSFAPYVVGLLGEALDDEAAIRAASAAG